jgi:hypothetical protein
LTSIHSALFPFLSTSPHGVGLSAG